MPPPAATQAAARLWSARVTNPAHLPRIPPKCRDNGNFTVCSWLKLATNDPASCKTRFTRGRVQELKNGHNSVTVQNRTHVYMNFSHHKDLGNHLLQLCPKVVKHPVCQLCCISVREIYDVLKCTGTPHWPVSWVNWISPDSPRFFKTYFNIILLSAVSWVRLTATCFRYKFSDKC